MLRIISVLAVLLAAFMPGAGIAAPIGANFAVDSPAGTSLTFAASGGWSVLVTPGFTGPAGTSAGYPLAQSWQGGGGVGVFSGPGDQHTVDNANGADYLRFQFLLNGQAQSVRVTAVTISCVGCDFAVADADASWRVGGDPLGAWINEDMTASGFMHTFALANNALSDSFLFGASRDNWDGLFDSFKVNAIAFELNAITFGSMVQVSEPSTLAALLIGLLLLHALSRRRVRHISVHRPIQPSYLAVHRDLAAC